MAKHTNEAHNKLKHKLVALAGHKATQDALQRYLDELESAEQPLKPSGLRFQETIKQQQKLVEQDATAIKQWLLKNVPDFCQTSKRLETAERRLRKMLRKNCTQRLIQTCKTTCTERLLLFDYLTPFFYTTASAPTQPNPIVMRWSRSVNHLLENGADVNFTDESSNNALAYVIKEGLNVYRGSARHCTYSLDMAHHVLYRESTWSSLKALIEAGADLAQTTDVLGRRATLWDVLKAFGRHAMQSETAFAAGGSSTDLHRDAILQVFQSIHWMKHADDTLVQLLWKESSVRGTCTRGWIISL